MSIHNNRFVLSSLGHSVGSKVLLIEAVVLGWTGGSVLTRSASGAASRRRRIVGGGGPPGSSFGYVFQSVLFTWAPNPDGSVIRGGYEHPRVDRVPGHAVDRPRMTAQLGDGGLLADVIHVNLVVLRTGRHKVLLRTAAEAAVNGVETLLDAGELPNQASFLHIPHVNSLIHNKYLL